MIQMALIGMLHQRYSAVRRFARTPLGSRLGWAFAFLLFFGGLAASLSAEPALFQNLHFKPFLIVFAVFVPAMTFTNILTMKQIARLSGVDYSYAAAFRLSVMSSAANNLPLPGGAVMRVASMCEAGAAFKNASLANVSAALLWMGATLWLGGVCALWINATIAAVFILIAIGATVTGLYIGQGLPGGLMSALNLFAISTMAAILYACSINLALLSLNAEIGFNQAAIVSASGVMGAAVSITPSGFGVREAIAAGLAQLIDASPAAAFAATAAVYVAMMMMLVLCALAFAWRTRAAPATSNETV